MYGIVDFYNKAKKYDIRPLIGVEMPYTADIHDLPPKRDIVKTL
jgi:DNA polymerase III alpha subunit